MLDPLLFYNTIRVCFAECHMTISSRSTIVGTFAQLTEDCDITVEISVKYYGLGSKISLCVEKRYRVLSSGVRSKGAFGWHFS